MSRIETDSLGPVEVPDGAYWGAQTQRSLINFAIGKERMPLAVLHALALIKKAAARVNDRNGDLPADIARLIEQAADEVLDGQHDEQFPLVVWQTGSGTQSNMNVNEVIAGRANELAGKGRGGKAPVHPNDHVNRSQSSNDCFPTAMHIAAAQAVHEQLLPAIAELSSGLAELSARHHKLVKTGRTHMMDATPITFGQEVSAFVAQLDYAQRAIRATLPAVCELAQGGTAVGTGLNAPHGFAEAIAAELAAESGLPFVTAPNKFAALAGHEPLTSLAGALKTLAVALMKIANDLRLLGSGPRAGLAEVRLPANEPGELDHAGQGQPDPVRGAVDAGLPGTGQRCSHRFCCQPGAFAAERVQAGDHPQPVAVDRTAGRWLPQLPAALCGGHRARCRADGRAPGAGLDAGDGVEPAYWL
ncbi:Fumarate hydratase class II [Pseudomonas sp. MM223]|nr:Fumarate hydratase class II [Pseudomonas sp. MM223]